MDLLINKEIKRINAAKLQAIIILSIMLVSMAAALWFYTELQKNHDELNATLSALETTQDSLAKKESIQDSLFQLVKRLDLINSDSSFLTQNRKLIQDYHEVSLGASASSTLPPQFSQKTNKRFTYDPSNVIDGDPTTAWVEGVEGYGETQTLTIEFNKDFPIRGIRILNGYYSMPSDSGVNKYLVNSRLSRAGFTFSDGTTESHLIEDTQEFQTIFFSEEKQSEFVRITIEGVFKGERDEDTCISEIEMIFSI